MVSKDYINNYLFKLKKSEIFTKDHLQFISDYLIYEGTESKAFKFFMENKEEINAQLGPDKAEYSIRSTIADECIPKSATWESVKPKWDLLERNLTQRFGALGQEVMYGKRMLYSRDVLDWKNFGKYFVLYFERALKRPEYMINNIAWTVFEKVEDHKVLESAIGVMKYDIETWDQQAADAYDTYANLLYKTGKRESAIEWEEKAVKLSKNKEIAENLEKMKKNQRTWPDVAVKP
jgi:tetratricopeptide (TPR) repeat protein